MPKLDGIAHRIVEGFEFLTDFITTILMILLWILWCEEGKFLGNSDPIERPDTIAILLRFGISRGCFQSLLVASLRFFDMKTPQPRGLITLIDGIFFSFQ